MITALANDDFLNQMRSVQDPAADGLVARCFDDESLKASLYQVLKTFDNNTDFFNIPTVFAGEEVFLKGNIFPEWADVKQLKRASLFFERYSSQIMQLLGLLSLPYCYAAADGAMVLYLSRRLRNDAAKRLQETGRFVLEVQEPGAFTEKGKGFAAILKTRLIHAIARFYTLKSDEWNLGWGLPLNQEDMAGTSLAFSLMVIRGLRKTGITVSNEDQQAFLQLWAVISYLLGVDERLIAKDGKTAHYLEALIRTRNFRSSMQGRELTRSLIASFKEIEENKSVSTKEIKQVMNFLLDDEVSEILGINDVEVPALLPYVYKIGQVLGIRL